MEKHQERIEILYHGEMTRMLSLTLDRSAKISLAEQIRQGIAAAIETGVLAPGARLPSWQDLAVQLGVARGTVRTAYEKLAAAQLIEASQARGTHVARRPVAGAAPPPAIDAGPFMATYRQMTEGPAPFQMGVPATEIFPATLFARLHAKAVRTAASAPPHYADPAGEAALRREIAGYLAVARGISCSPAEIIVTGGFGAGLGLALRALSLEGETAWIEDPGFPWSRKALELARLLLAPIPVDAAGIDVEYGLRHHGGAGLVLVTPGQQAPLGATLSLERRLRLLDWATDAQAWIIEDDYLSELQLSGRAAPALASLDRGGRVIHIGSFSKTISPAIRLGFIVVPPAELPRFAEVAAVLAPPPGPAVQLAIAEFMREGHYLRHLRRSKRNYVLKRAALLETLGAAIEPDRLSTPGLAVLLRLPNGVSDVAVAHAAMSLGLAPSPLSPWYASPERRQSGLLLGVATTPTRQLAAWCERLLSVVPRPE